MAGVKHLHPNGTDYDRFLYAYVGEDRNGSGVTVVSALARLGFDPWKEAAELAKLGQKAAQTRLEARLLKLQDVPALSLDHTSVAIKLILLLPRCSTEKAPKLIRPATLNRPRVSTSWIFAVLIVGLVLLRVYFLAHAG